MKLFKFLSIIVCLGFLLPGCGSHSSSESSSLAQSSPQTAMPHFQVFELPKSKVYTLRIPAQSSIQLGVSSSLETVEQLAKKYQAKAAINAGFFDPKNQKTMSYLTVDSQSVGKPEDNPNLMKNPKLKAYFPQIFNRSEFRRYQCNQGSNQVLKYAIAVHNAPIPSGCQLIDSVGGGPQLLPNLTATEEAFWHEEKGQVLRDAIGLKQPNARTAIALFPNGDVFWVMAAQKPTQKENGGLSLTELAEFLKAQGVQEALNLDGGSSSTFYYQNQTYNGKFDQEGNAVLRPVKSVLFIH